jgi:hypothetical protein
LSSHSETECDWRAIFRVNPKHQPSYLELNQYSPPLYCFLTGALKIKIYKTIILTLVLYGYGIWFLTLMQEHRLGVLEHRMLIIFEFKMEEVRKAGDD